jgi:hypothetical protein
MLIGYAIEVAAKGLIVAADQSEATIDRISRKHIDHALLEEAGIELVAGNAFLADQTLYHAVREVFFSHLVSILPSAFVV